jgi:hypothetical protein
MVFEFLVLAQANPLGDDPFNLAQLVTALDGIAAWLSLGLTVFVGIMGFLPLGAEAAAVPAIAGMGVLLVNLVLQIYLSGGQIDESILMMGAFWDMVLVGLSYAFASQSLVVLLVLGLYIARIGIPGATERCKGVCFDITQGILRHMF